MHAPFTKVVRLGTIDDYRNDERRHSVFAEVRYDEDGELHVVGVEGPYHSGNCYGSCGQIVMSYRTAAERARLRPAPGWDAEKIAKFFDLWDRWHLNHMTAGSPRQEEYKQAHPEKFEVEYPTSHYANACKVLADAGLNPDTEYLHDGEPYSYGHAWLKTDVPDDVVEFFAGLPDTDKEPAWV